MSALAAPGVAALRALVARATLAPSTHNAQPWRWSVHPDHVELELDQEVGARLQATDPEHRELVISCGAALLTFRVAAAQALFVAQVDLLPDPHRSDLLACVTLVPGTVDAAFAALDDVVPLRRTAWSSFDERPLPDGLLERLAAEALAEGVELVEVARPQRETLIALVEHADRDRYTDPERRAELAGWVTAHRLGAGGGRLTSSLTGPVRAAARHFPLAERVAAHDAGLVRAAPQLAVLATTADSRADWLAAGQALQRVLLVAAEHGVSAGYLNAPCQVDTDRELLRELLPDGAYPQLVLRLGYPQVRPVASARRPLQEVVEVHDGLDEREDAAVDAALAREAGEDFSEDTLG